jgi:Flp pilus assembly protein TadG
MLAAVIQKLVRGSARSPFSRDFVHCRNGATTVEFAMVATPFIALLVAILQTVLVFFAQRVLDEVTEEASRYIMTGQAQTGGVTQSGFSTYLCTSANTSALVSALFTCNNIMVNVQNYAAFASANTSTPTLTYNPNGTVSNTWNYSAGNAGDIVVVQVMYQWPVVLGPLNFNLGNLSNGNRLLISTAVFKNEPY